jgi:hypothetical protein
MTEDRRNAVRERKSTFRLVTAFPSEVTEIKGKPEICVDNYRIFTPIYRFKREEKKHNNRCSVVGNHEIETVTMVINPLKPNGNCRGRAPNLGRVF